MWPVKLGTGAVALLFKALFDDEEDSGRELKERIFISFAIEDEQDCQVAQKAQVSKLESSANSATIDTY